MTMINEQKKDNQFPQHPPTTPLSISRRPRKGDHPLRPNSCHVTSKPNFCGSHVDRLT